MELAASVTQACLPVNGLVAVQVGKNNIVTEARVPGGLQRVGCRKLQSTRGAGGARAR